MLEPSVVELLNGVAASLRADVVDELPPGPARDQVRDAIAVIRRVARSIPGITPYLLTDIADIAATVERLGGTPPPAAATLPADASAVELDTLIALDLQLRDQLAALAERADLDDDAEAHLRAALGRLTDREAGLRLSPWER